MFLLSGEIIKINRSSSFDFCCFQNINFRYFHLNHCLLHDYVFYISKSHLRKLKLETPSLTIYNSEQVTSQRQQLVNIENHTIYGNLSVLLFYFACK